MNTQDLQVLARRADEVHGRETTRLGEVHDRIAAVRRRRQLSVAGTLVLLLVAGAATAALALRLRGDAHPAPPVGPSPSPTRTERPDLRYVAPPGKKGLTLRQTVQSVNARLAGGITLPEDRDVRLSVWFTRCGACADDHTHGLHWAMALTRDGYRTTRYLRVPGVGNVPDLSSPAPGVFLLGDPANGEYWLLRPQGRPRHVSIVAQRRSVTDPRLVFPCLTDTAVGGAARTSRAAGQAWCVLDVESATAAPLSTTWAFNGDSFGNPTQGQRPWGLTGGLYSGTVDAWWQDHGTRRTAPLGNYLYVDGVPSLRRNDPPVFARWSYGARSMELFVVEDRAGGLPPPVRRSWLPLSGAETGRAMDPLSVNYARTPEGGLLAWSSSEAGQDHLLRIWRAPSLLHGAFALVYDSRATNLERLDARVEGGRLYLGPLASDDDGRRWSDAVDRWR